MPISQCLKCTANCSERSDSNPNANETEIGFPLKGTKQRKVFRDRALLNVRAPVPWVGPRVFMSISRSIQLPLLGYTRTRNTATNSPAPSVQLGMAKRFQSFHLHRRSLPTSYLGHHSQRPPRRHWIAPPGPQMNPLILHLNPAALHTILPDEALASALPPRRQLQRSMPPEPRSFNTPGTRKGAQFQVGKTLQLPIWMLKPPPQTTFRSVVPLLRQPRYVTDLPARF